MPVFGRLTDIMPPLRRHDHRRKIVSKACFKAVAVLLCLLLGQSVAAREVHEYQLRAVYLYNIAQFITWPDSEQEEHFNICVIGDNPFDSYLDAVKSKSVRNRPMRILYLPEGPQAGERCHIAYTTEERPDLKLSNGAVVSIGESSDFLKNGGMISLVLVNKKVSILIDLAKFKPMGLNVSANLLEVARVVR